MLLGQTRAGLKFEVATRALSALKAYVGEQRSSMFCIAKLARKLIKFQNSKPQTRNGGAACTFPTRVRISCILQASHNNSWGWVSLLVAWNALTRSILLACDFVKASQCIAIVTKEEDVMCFRPPDTTSGPLICPECGKKSCHRISDRSITPSVRLRFRPKALPRLLRQVGRWLLPALRRCQVHRSLHLGNSRTAIMA